MFYAGEAVIELHRTESAFYRDNLAAETPRLWVVLSPTASAPPYQLLSVTADPAEGEGFTDAGNNLVDTVAHAARDRCGRRSIHRHASRRAAVHQAPAQACRIRTPKGRARERDMTAPEKLTLALVATKERSRFQRSGCRRPARHAG